MKTLQVNLNSIERVKAFVQESMKVSTDVTITSLDGRYVIDGKSIMGIFSLDLTKNVNISYEDSEVAFEKYLKSL